MPLPELPAVLARARLDRRRLHELTVLGHTLGPEEAVAAGFLDELVEGDDLEAVALDRGRQIAELSEAAYRGTLASVWRPEIARITALVSEQISRRDAARTGAA
jgi:enoyl-CoA hydratase/carnithine racemase